MVSRRREWLLYQGLLLFVVLHCEAQTDERYILSTTSFPDDLREVPAVGNGHIATQVFSNTIYMNGLMNGYERNSHRARIPSYSAFNISIDGTESIEYTLDMYKGIFSKTLEHQCCTLEQRIYAHRVHTRLLINEFTVQRKAGQTGDKTINLAPNSGPESPDIDLNTFDYSYLAHHTFGQIKERETNTSGDQRVHIFWSHIPSSVVLTAGEDQATHTYVTSISPVRGDALFSYEQATTFSSQELLNTHQQAWQAIWDAGRLEVEGNVTLAQILNAAFFHILISTPDTYDPTNPFAGLSPGGLARGGKINPASTGGPFNDYAGHVFWDMDTWILPPVLMLFPDKVKHYLDSRMRVFTAVKQHAEETGYDGVRFPWEQGVTGTETCPWDPASEFQVHVTADVSYALRQYLYSTNDIDYLYSRGGRTMVLEIARFWKSRAISTVRGTEILGVMGPDEYHFNIDNSVYTNYQARLSMSFPKYLEDLGVNFIGVNPGEVDELRAWADDMIIVFNEQEQFHPQFEGFNHTATQIKQSDVVLLGYPLMMDMTPQVRENDLTIYEGLTDEFGPDTGTWSMHTVGWLELGKPSVAENMFFKMFRNINGPFLIFSEKPSFSEEGMRATNFITGAGGLLQAVFFGYASIRVTEHQMDFLTPYSLPYSESWKIVGLDYRGFTFDLRVETLQIHLRLVSRGSNMEPVYLVRHGDLVMDTLSTGTEYSFAPQKSSIVVHSELYRADLPGEISAAPCRSPLLTLTITIIVGFALRLLSNE